MKSIWIFFTTLSTILLLFVVTIRSWDVKPSHEKLTPNLSLNTTEENGVPEDKARANGVSQAETIKKIALLQPPLNGAKEKPKVERNREIIIKFYAPTWVQKVYSDSTEMTKYYGAQEAKIRLEGLDGLVISNTTYATATLNGYGIDLASFKPDQGAQSAWFTKENLENMRSVDLSKFKK